MEEPYCRTEFFDRQSARLRELSEFSSNGLHSRFGQKRADVNHQWIDPLLVGGPWVLAGLGAVAAVRALRPAAVGRR